MVLNNQKKNHLCCPSPLYTPNHISRVWIRYRGRAISGVKSNFKNSHKNDLECRFCPRNTDKPDLNGSQDFSDESQKYPDEIEELFSVYHGTMVIKYPEETQEHLEVCKGTTYERRGIQDIYI